jgi:crossover junction endodeoxyribonuclease RuvC
MTSFHLAAIDVGKTGAVASSAGRGGHEGSVVTDLPVMGSNKQTIVNGGALAEILRDGEINHVVIELVSAMPKQGVSSMFKFGRTFGQVLGVVQALGIPYEFVTAAKWKREMGLPGGEAAKEVARQRAIERFPHLGGRLARKMDHNRAEALLLGLWWWERRSQSALGSETRVRPGRSTRRLAK